MNAQNKQCHIIVVLLAMALLVSTLFTGCGSTPPTQETTEPVEVEETESIEEPPEEPAETEPEAEPEEVEIVPSFEEDANLYGNSMGNLYNGGIFVDCGDGSYIENNGYGRVFLLNADGDATLLDKLDTWYMNYKDGQLFGVQRNLDGEVLGLLYAVIDEEAKNIITMIDETVAPETLFWVNDNVYYADVNTHRLYRYQPEGEDELLIDTEVYHPVFYKDQIIYQKDADGESLHSVSMTGKEDVKLNDVRSYWPIVYRDKIYYQAVADAAYTLRRMNLDGSEDTEVAKIRYQSPVICQDRLFLIDLSEQDILSCLDLTQEDKGILTIDISGKMEELYAGREAVFGLPEDSFMNYKIEAYGNLSNIDDKLMFEAFYSDPQDGESLVYLSAVYDPASDKVTWSPYASCDGKWETSRTVIVTDSGNMEARGTGTDSAASNMASNAEDTAAPEQKPKAAAASAHSYYANCTEEQAAQADAVAKQIADSVMGNASYTTDLQKVSAAAQMVKSYCDRAVYDADENKYYRTPYGVFVSGQYTCAGSTRALGRVLDFMGFAWTHANENQWVHQWCILTMDGQIGYADGMGGIAGYGEMVNGMTLEDGRSIYFYTE